MNGRLPNEDDVAAAAARLAPFVRRTPLVELEVEGRRVLAKLEHMQLSGSFKLRGALNSSLLARGAPRRHVGRGIRRQRWTRSRRSDGTPRHEGARLSAFERLPLTRFSVSRGRASSSILSMVGTPTPSSRP